MFPSQPQGEFAVFVDLGELGRYRRTGLLPINWIIVNWPFLCPEPEVPDVPPSFPLPKLPPQRKLPAAGNELNSARIPLFPLSFTLFFLLLLLFFLLFPLLPPFSPLPLPGFPGDCGNFERSIPFSREFGSPDSLPVISPRRRKTFPFGRALEAPRGSPDSWNSGLPPGKGRHLSSSSSSSSSPSSSSSLSSGRSSRAGPTRLSRPERSGPGLPDLPFSGM